MIKLGQEIGVNWLKLTVLIDNNPNPRNKSLLTRWGLSILGETPDIRFLFDTGPDPQALAYNSATLGINLGAINYVFISHMHLDHYGGIEYIIKRNPGIKVYIPENSYMVKRLKEEGANPVLVENGMRVCKGIYLVKIPTFIQEQSIVIRVKNYLVLLVGCSHPGIENIVSHVVEKFKTPIYAIIGGFHIGLDIPRLMRIVEIFRKVKVREIYPIHCTGEDAKEFLKRKLSNIYKEGYVGLSLYYR